MTWSTKFEKQTLSINGNIQKYKKVPFRMYYLLLQGHSQQKSLFSADLSTNVTRKLKVVVNEKKSTIFPGFLTFVHSTALGV